MLTSWHNKTTIIAFRQETLSMERQEIRRVQRLGSFQKVLRLLEKAVQLVSTERIAGDEHSLMQDGLMQRYEFSVEYGVETKRLNEVVNLNINRFQEDFMFVLTAEEWLHLRLQIATSNTDSGSLRSHTILV